MVFKRRDMGESQVDNSRVESGARGLSVTPLVASALLAIIAACMIGSYFLGFRAGRSNGLELASANTISQVVRNPVAKEFAEDSQSEKSSDTSEIYAKLKEPIAIKQADTDKKSEVSKEVKEFLQPTPTPNPRKSASAASSTAQVAAVSATPVINEKKRADTVAIEKALQEAKQIEQEVASDLALVAETQPAVVETPDPAVRVIGQANSSEAAVPVGKVVGKQIRDENKIAFGAAESSDQEIINTKLEDFSEPSLNAKVDSGKKIQIDAAVEKEEQKQFKAEGKKVEVKPTKAPVPTPTSKVINENKDGNVGAKLPLGWYTQVAAPKSLQEAQSMATKLKNAGFKVKIETAEVRDQQYYRVVVGPEASRLGAEDVLMKVRRQTAIKSEPFIRMVK